ncbi:MAG TPA: SDR family NAD(P)-dependent oxidoreductase [Acidimicrobiales bacterium]
MTAPARNDFADRYGRWAVVAGASEGVGAAGADELAARGLDVLLLARNGPLLEELAADLRARHGVEARMLVVDFTDADAAERVLAATDGLEVGTLLYNAGAAGSSGTFLDQDLAHAMKMIALNCTMPVALVHGLAPAMVERGRGAVVLVGSMGCFAGQPYVASYSAAKAFQINLAEGLWAELKDRGVDVLEAVIGSTTTPARARRLGVGVDEHLDMSSEDVAREIVEHIADGPSRVIAKLTSGIGHVAQPWSEFREFALQANIDAMAGFNARTNVGQPD